MKIVTFQYYMDGFQNAELVCLLLYGSADAFLSRLFITVPERLVTFQPFLSKVRTS